MPTRGRTSWTGSSTRSATSSADTTAGRTRRASSRTSSSATCPRRTSSPPRSAAATPSATARTCCTPSPTAASPCWRSCGGPGRRRRSTTTSPGASSASSRASSTRSCSRSTGPGSTWSRRERDEHDRRGRGLRAARRHPPRAQRGLAHRDLDPRVRHRRVEARLQRAARVPPADPRFAARGVASLPQGADRVPLWHDRSHRSARRPRSSLWGSRRSRARGRPRIRTATEPVPSLTPVATKASGTSWSRIRRRRPFARAQRLRTRARDRLRRHRLAPRRDEARREPVAVRAVLRLDPAARGQQVAAARRPGLAHPRARAGVPRGAEINVTGWTSWVSTTGSTWYAAGVEARRRMAAAGYDVAAGDIWALNEISSAVRQGTGSARQNMRDFLDGLYDGDGVLPVSRGAVWVIGFAQDAASNSVYQSRLQDWYGDQQFWTAMARDVERLAAGGLRRRAQVRRRRAPAARPGATRSTSTCSIPPRSRPPRRQPHRGEGVRRLDLRPARERRVAVGERPTGSRTSRST